MSANTKIEWADHTFNPWIGCTKVSPGCTNCYAEGESKRRGWAQWGKGKERRRTSASYWKQPLRWWLGKQAPSNVWLLGILFLHGRLYFHHISGLKAVANSGAPSALVAYGYPNVEALSTSDNAGSLVTSWRCN